MMLRILFALLATATLGRASEVINAPADGASTTVTQPHSTADLIPETTTVQPGQPFDVALHLHDDPDWHTYWINPGDAGLATTIAWTLPPGFTAGPIQWPTPEKHAMGPLITYGYGGDVYLLTTITPPKADLPQHFDIKAQTEWLVCKEECIPGKADLTVSLDSGMLNLRLPKENTELFALARARLPVANTRWLVKGEYGPASAKFIFTDLTGASPAAVSGQAYFFPELGNVLSATEDVAKIDKQHPPGGFSWPLDLQQNGDKPDKMSGVLVSDQPLIRNAKAVYFASFPVTSEGAAGGPGGNLTAAAAPAAPAASSSTSAPPPAPTIAVPTATAFLAVLGAAFLGGLILNLMPCVLPVLSLKVFSLIKHAGDHSGAAWKQGVAFTVGVVLSFWLLAGVLLALRAAGNEIGWGFQMQSPGFVFGLVLLFFLLALNLFGVFELGSSLVGLDAKATSGLGGSASSFGNGALATLAATPCTAPFMGSALGFAAQQPAFVSMLIFTFLALGMATPYLLLTLFPGALRFVPKPGAWMEAFKQFMGFLLMASVIYLVYVFGALVGEDQLPWLLAVLLLAGVAAWIYGRFSSPIQGPASRAIGVFLALALLISAIAWGVNLSRMPPSDASTTATSAGAWQPWSPDAVAQALAQNRPVFVDFTAAWCLSCKVNEAVALGTDAVKKSFADKNVALFRADWTHSDPRITETLHTYHVDGVPLYLLYSPKNKDAPEMLPQVLTPSTVLDALGRL